ncbi:MAG: type II toxin-antitoxin system VapC family toxin [Chloroflexi bacterium]|nr:type II toxin-antitoxin system VapC family toxin [Chloroflexota bacterium]
MKYLLDTCTCIFYINGKKPQVRVNLHKRTADDIRVSSVTKCEMFAGSGVSKTPQVSRQKQERFLIRFESLPFDDDAANQYGNIHSFLRARGKLINVPDMQIAAIALAHNLIVVTSDTDDFGRIPDLKIEDWTLV